MIALRYSYMSSKNPVTASTRIHLIGIGGIGMSGLARLLRHEKKQVSGSDATASDITAALEEEGVTFYPTQQAANIDSDIELVVYTEAMDSDHEEMKAARALGVPMLNYFEALAFAVNDYFLIAVSGTHGKTTTTAMLVDIFEAAGLDPTAVVGSLRAKTKSNFRFGKSKYAIVEACEYRQDFLSLEPDVLVITNLEHDHVDFYPDLAAVQQTFASLVAKVDEKGCIVAKQTDPQVQPALAEAAVPVRNYQEYLDPQLQLKVPGLHNLENAAAAAAVAAFCGVPAETIHQALTDFAGTWRRYEYKGTVNGAAVYDDYAHHPTALRATITATRELYPESRIIAIFEPHTYTRTAALFAEFAKALALADRVILAPIYAARETNESGVSSRELTVKVTEYNPNVSYGESHEAIVEQIRQSTSSEDVVLVLGAGPITQIADMVIDTQ